MVKRVVHHHRVGFTDPEVNYHRVGGQAGVLFSFRHEIYALMDTGLRLDGLFDDRVRDCNKIRRNGSEFDSEMEDQETSPLFKTTDLCIDLCIFPPSPTA